MATPRNVQPERNASRSRTKAPKGASRQPTDGRSARLEGGLKPWPECLGAITMLVVPAQAGTQRRSLKRHWVPAYAGTTASGCAGFPVRKNANSHDAACPSAIRTDLAATKANSEPAKSVAAVSNFANRGRKKEATDCAGGYSVACHSSADNRSSANNSRGNRAPRPSGTRGRRRHPCRHLCPI